MDRRYPPEMEQLLYRRNQHPVYEGKGTVENIQPSYNLSTKQKVREIERVFRRIAHNNTQVSDNIQSQIAYANRIRKHVAEYGDK